MTNPEMYLEGDVRKRFRAAVVLDDIPHGTDVVQVPLPVGGVGPQVHGHILHHHVHLAT